MDCWADPQGELYRLAENVSPDIAAAAVIKSYFDKELTKAAQGYDGSGMENGIDMDATLALVRNSKSVDYPLKCILESILSATMWPAARVHAIAPSVSPICSRCGQEEESSLHCYWTCPCNAAIKDEAVASSQSLVDAAVRHSPKYACMWLRGVLPSELTKVHAKYAPPAQVIPHFSQPPPKYTSGRYYGDGSGGEFSSTTVLRRCGCAIVQVDENGNRIHAVRFPLPGAVQTVPRSEVYCLKWLVDNVEPLSEIHYVTDNLNLSNTFAKGPCAGQLSSNADLYWDIFKTIYDKALKVTVSWMPSHLTKSDEVPSFVTEADLKGNAYADEEAGLAAKSACLPLNVTAPIIYHHLLINRATLRPPP